MFHSEEYIIKYLKFLFVMEIRFLLFETRSEFVLYLLILYREMLTVLGIRISLHLNTSRWLH